MVCIVLASSLDPRTVPDLRDVALYGQQLSLWCISRVSCKFHTTDGRKGTIYLLFAIWPNIPYLTQIGQDPDAVPYALRSTSDQVRPVPDILVLHMVSLVCWAYYQPFPNNKTTNLLSARFFCLYTVGGSIFILSAMTYTALHPYPFCSE